jgi:hypothetical protein
MAGVLSLTQASRAAPVIFSAGGDDTPASIQATVDSFRAALGDPLNGNDPGPLGSGRREINWDGGGATEATPVPTPFTGFLDSRGGNFTTPGTGFLQTTLDDADDFLSINPTYGDTFGFFSAQRIFTPLGSNITDATFAVPGTDGELLATVAGFGVVFTDVDLADTTSLEFFDTSGDSLGKFFVEPGSTEDASLSFLGVLFDAGERVLSVRITTGTAALGPNDDPSAGVDVVAMDDFLYSEPQAVPEPSSLALAGCAGLATLAGLRRGRRRRVG